MNFLTSTRNLLLLAFTISSLTHAQNFADIYARAQSLREQKLYSQALAHYTDAATNVPTDSTVRLEFANHLLTLGNHFFSEDQGEYAAQAFRAIILFAPQCATAYHNLGFCVGEKLGNHHDAQIYFRRALELDPTNAETHFSYALSCLACGDFERGWQEYLYRWQRKHLSPRPSITSFSPEWTGQDVHDKTVFIRCEQGLGDTLHFIRYARLVKELGAHVIAEVQKPLIALVSLCPYIDEVTIMGHVPMQFDYQVPLMNLPLIFKTNATTIPCTSYLYADPHLEIQWRHYLRTTGKDTFKIGLCWYGDKANSSSKYIPLTDLAPIMSLPGVTVYSLQMMTGLDQLEQLPTTCHLHLFDSSFDKEHGAFMDTAAVMKGLDLIITVDTSIAHLAGGLGIKTWVILPFSAEWRWQVKRTDSPWYPSMRLFRKKTRDNWTSTQEELLHALHYELQTR